MKTTRAILTGIIVWILGVGVFITSFFIPLMENPELQANIALALTLLVLAWLGAANFFKKYPNASAIKLASIMVGIAIFLDAAITVPFLVLPIGGSYKDFFSAPSFWFIALEYYLVVLLYWYLKVKPEAWRKKKLFIGTTHR